MTGTISSKASPACLQCAGEVMKPVSVGQLGQAQAGGKWTDEQPNDSSHVEKSSINLKTADHKKFTKKFTLKSLLASSGSKTHQHPLNQKRAFYSL